MALVDVLELELGHSDVWREYRERVDEAISHYMRGN